MVSFWLLIDTIAMIGSPASRGAVPSVACSGRAWRGAASAGGTAVSAVRAAAAASVAIAGGAHRRTTSVDWAVVHRFVMRCPGCQGGIASTQTLRTGGWSLFCGPWSINTNRAATSGRGGAAAPLYPALIAACGARRGGLVHDPEKWKPPFRKDHAQT